MNNSVRRKGRVISAAVIALFAAAAVVSAIFMNKVGINYNLADYLGDETQTKTALDIIDDEFGMTGTIQVMAKNVSADTAEEMADKTEGVKNVLNVNFDKYDEAYYKDSNALFNVIVDGDDYSDNAKQVTQDIKSALKGYDGLEYGGTAVEKQELRESMTSEMTYILALSLCLVATILLITSESWLEPLVLLAASGVAVLLNRGTNVFFGEISYITNSISAILQLALSIDYSIVLLHTYRREKESAAESAVAMKKAILSVIKPVSASALTTIAGLLALLFMSFKIGFDIGVVLIKGIVISAVTSVTLLPALVLLLEKPMKRLHKRSFVPKGDAFCKLAFKAGKVIVPLALVAVIVCGMLQTGNTFVFTDTKAGNAAISDVFGKNNSVVVVYKNSADSYSNEQKLADALAAYKTKSGKSVLSDYTAYTNTVREEYDAQKAVRKLELSESETQLLFTMYNLYRSPEQVQLTFAEFVSFANSLTESDPDVKDFVDGDTSDTLSTLKAVGDITSSDLTAADMYKQLSSAMKDADISEFAVRQLYGLYFYDKVKQPQVDFCTMLDYIIAASENENTKAMFDSATVTQLKALSDGVKEFKAKMETPMDKAALKGWIYQNAGVALDDMQLAQIWGGYFSASGLPESDTVQFLPMMKFLSAGGMLTDPTAAATVSGYDELYTAVGAKYGYKQFLPALTKIAAGLSGQAPQVAVTDEAVQQLYIMYFYKLNAMPSGKLSGKAFAEYALKADGSNSVVHAQLSESNRNSLNDMLTVSGFFADEMSLTYEGAYDKLTELQGQLKSSTASAALDKDKVSGVFIKYAVNVSGALNEPMRACELLDFISGNMDSNSLLKQKMSDSNREKVADAQDDIAKAEDLFTGENYSRMLLSVDLPNESDETTDFVARLSDEVKDVFGDGAYITGEIVSTYDLEQSFSHDNMFITVFTLISIFVIVMVIFRSLSLPVILVAVIQGAIFIAMSTQLLGDGIFFMSYIVSTCILMGATIDYGILMSSNFVALRKELDRKQALLRAVSAAMPTVFTSGLILTVCGFVIHFVSSQSSISSVGLLIGIGTICSVVMITLVLPSVLYLLDKFIMRLTLRSKGRKE